MENLIKMDDLGVKPTIFGNIHLDVLLEVDGSKIRISGLYPRIYPM